MSGQSVGGKEISIKLFGGALTLRGKSWGEETAPPSHRILAWPGWLDNCGSWYTSAPYYAKAGYWFVAIDPVGCGLSDHRPVSSYYNDFEECLHIIYIADILGWKEPFILMGHSRGSNIVSTTAAMFSSRIRAAILHETWFSMFGCYMTNYEGTSLDEKEAAKGEPLMGSTRQLVLQSSRRNNRKPKKFVSFEEAMKHNNSHPWFPKTIETSTNIAARHVGPIYGCKQQESKEESGQKFKLVFTHDTKTYGQNQSHMIHPAANIAVKSNISCPVLILNVKDGIWKGFFDFDIFQKVFKVRSIRPVDALTPTLLRWVFDDIMSSVSVARKHVTIKLVPGKHHVHSDDPELCTSLVKNFLKSEVHDVKSDLPVLPVIDIRKKCFEEYKELLQLPDDSNMTEGVMKSKAAVKREERVFVSFESKVAVVLWSHVESAGGPSASSKTVLRFLCVSDDQDNAGSFELIAPRLVAELSTRFNATVVLAALDRPGRGNSDRVSSISWYDPLEEPGNFLNIADELNWQSFHLLSHCRGALIASVVASAFPERVDSLICLSAFTETSEPLSLPNEFLCSEMHQAYLESKEVGRSEPQLPLQKFYRSRKATKVMEKREELFNYARDARLDRRLPLGCAEETLERALKQITAPVLVLCPQNEQTEAIQRFLSSTMGFPASSSAKSSRSELTLAFLKRNVLERSWFRKARVEVVPFKGSRYAHVDNVEVTTELISSFVARNNLSLVSKLSHL